MERFTTGVRRCEVNVLGQSVYVIQHDLRVMAETCNVS